VYGILAIAATFRSGVQIARDLDRAPLAYLLSALAAVVYMVATVALAKGTPGWRQIAWAAVGLELLGVLSVGTLSLAEPDLFPAATVWSGSGQGCGYVPLVLPVLGMLWLHRTVPTDGSAAAPGPTAPPGPRVPSGIDTPDR